MDADQPISAPPRPKPKPVPQRKTASQKAMELKERDVRVLIRSLQRWGDIRQRYDVIVRLFCRVFRFGLVTDGGLCVVV